MLVDPDGHYIQFVVAGGVAIYRGYKIHKGYKKIKKVKDTNLLSLEKI